MMLLLSSHNLLTWASLQHNTNEVCQCAEMTRLSGLQRDVLALYRSCLRAARKKPAGTRPHFEAFARREFQKHIQMNKKDFSTIEFLLRKGNRQLEIYKSPGVTDIAG